MGRDRMHFSKKIARRCPFYVFRKFNSKDWLRGRKTCSVLFLCRTTFETFLRDEAFPFVSIVSVIKTNKYEREALITKRVI